MHVSFLSLEMPGNSVEMGHRLKMQEAAELILANPPMWLSKLLSHAYFAVQSAAMAEQGSPTRKRLSEDLTRMMKSSIVLRDALKLLSDQGFVRGEHEALDRILGDLIGSISIARQSRDIVGKDGRIRSGSGKALPPEVMPAKYVCAAIVAEIVSYFQNGNDPARSNLRACRVAELLWSHPKVADQKNRSWGNDPAKGWKRYFLAAKRPELKKIRLEFRRYLVLNSPHLPAQNEIRSNIGVF